MISTQEPIKRITQCLLYRAVRINKGNDGRCLLPCVIRVDSTQGPSEEFRQKNGMIGSVVWKDFSSNNVEPGTRLRNFCKDAGKGMERREPQVALWCLKQHVVSRDIWRERGALNMDEVERRGSCRHTQHFNSPLGISLEVQWLRLCTSTAQGTGSVPGEGTKIPHDMQPKERKRSHISPTIKIMIHTEHIYKMISFTLNTYSFLPLNKN